MKITDESMHDTQIWRESEDSTSAAIYIYTHTHTSLVTETQHWETKLNTKDETADLKLFSEKKSN